MVKTLQASASQAIEGNTDPIMDVPQITEEERQRGCAEQLELSLQLERTSATGRLVNVMKHLH